MKLSKEVKVRSWDEYDLGIDVSLDKYDLDFEAERQSHLVQKWLELLNEEQRKLSKAKEGLLNVEAELLLDVKREGIPDLEGKPTEATVKAHVRVQDKYQKALNKKLKHEGNVNYLQNAKTALEHKKAMIKIEADLWITGYFSKPGVNATVSKEQGQIRMEEHKGKLIKSMKKRHLRQQGDEDGS